MENSRKKGSTVILAAVVSNFLMLLGRIPFARMFGEVGTGYYAAIYEMFAFVMIFIGWYLPQAENKAVRARISRGQIKNADRVLKGTLMFAAGTGLLTSLLVVVFSAWISDALLLQPLLSLAVCVMAPTFFLSAVISVYRGYFEGIGTMAPTFISRILEQIFGIGFGLIFAKILYDYGEKVGKLKQNPNCASAYGVVGAAIGMVAAQLLVLIFLVFINKSYNPAFKRRRLEYNSKIKESYTDIIRSIIFGGIPQLAMMLFVNGPVFIDLLLYFHYTHKNTAQNYSLHYGSFYEKYGILMGILICLLCFMMLKPLAAIVQFHRREDYRAVKDRFSGTLHAFCIYGIPIAVFLAFLAQPVTDMLYGTVKGTIFLLQVSSSLLVMIPCAIFFNYVLQMIGKQILALRNCAVSFVVHVVFMLIFLKVMHLGIASVVYGYMVLFGLMMVLGGMTLFRYLKYSPEYIRMLGVPVMASLISGMLMMLLSKALFKTAGGLITSIVCIVLGMAGYVVLLFALKGVNEKELSRIPGGTILIKAGQLLHFF